MKNFNYEYLLNELVIQTINAEEKFKFIYSTELDWGNQFEVKNFLEVGSLVFTCYFIDHENFKYTLKVKENFSIGLFLIF